MRIYTEKIICELWPKAARIEVSYKRTYPSVFDLRPDEWRTVSYVPDFDANIPIDCYNTDCTVGYFDLWSVVSGMYHNGETFCEGTMECRGNEAPDHSNRCPCTLHYEITIEYIDG